MRIESQQHRPVVVIESPFAGNSKRNIKFARECLRDSIMRGETPFASHLLYTQPNVLDDDIPQERKMGIEAGFAIKHLEGVKTIFYTDLGWSGGMEVALFYCRKFNLPYDIRLLNPQDVEMVNDD